MQEISLETVCFIVTKAHEFDAKVPAQVADPGSNPSDDREVEVLQTEPDDATEEELRGAIEGLADDELAELVAIFRMGRGDYAGEQLNEAVAEATGMDRARSVAFLMGTPLLGDHLENGLSLLGRSCQEFEINRL